MRSARSASRVLEEAVWWWPWPLWGKALPRWPSLIAVVERAEREVVAEFGVPLFEVSFSFLSFVYQGLGKGSSRCFCWRVWVRGRIGHVDQCWSGHVD